MGVLNLVLSGMVCTIILLLLVGTLCATLSQGAERNPNLLLSPLKEQVAMAVQNVQGRSEATVRSNMFHIQ